MNKSQRDFLWKKVETKFNKAIEKLEDQKPERPRLENFILHEIMKETVKIISKKKLKEILLNRAKHSEKFGNVFADNGFFTNNGRNKVAFKLEEFFIIPEDYKIRVQNYEKTVNELQSKIDALKVQKETLEVRINLASGVRLEKVIMEVDDLGDLSLFDTNLKIEVLGGKDKDALLNE